MKCLNLSALLVALFVALISNGAALEAENIIGSSLVRNERAFPYFVYILTRGHSSCGGSLVAPDLVLTAAHCIYDGLTGQFYDRPLRVYAGSTDVRSASYSATVSKIYLHRSYQIDANFDYYNDIALLRLDASFDISGRLPIGRVNLPQKYEEVYGPVILAAAGYDEIREVYDPYTFMTKHVGKSHGKLKFANLEIANDRYNCHASQNSGVFCATAQKTTSALSDNACFGDSGSPVLGEGTDTVVGIVSYGSTDCNDYKRPTHYTKVSHYIDFINSAINDVQTNDMVMYYSNYKTLYIPIMNGGATIKWKGPISTEQLESSRLFEQLVDRLVNLKATYDANPDYTTQSEINQTIQSIRSLWQSAVVEWVQYA